jgi:hypothetical protein
MLEMFLHFFVVRGNSLIGFRGHVAILPTYHYLTACDKLIIRTRQYPVVHDGRATSGQRRFTVLPAQPGEHIYSYVV